MKALKILLVISVSAVVIVFAVWSGLEFHDYEQAIVYSDKNLIRALQYFSVGAWGVITVVSPAWVLGAILATVKIVFPNTKF